MNAISIILAEPHYLVREGLKAILKDISYLNIEQEAEDEGQLLSCLDPSRPQLVIFDYQEPGFSPETVKHIFKHNAKAQVLVISSGTDRSSILETLRHGAKGFLLKNCDKGEIVGAIHAVSRKEKFFCNKVLDILLEREISPANEACEPTQLTERESEVVRLMAEGLSAQQIADQLFLSVHTIYTHRKNIMKKLKVSTAAEVILYGINTTQQRS